MSRRLLSLVLVLLMLGWATPVLAQQALIQDALRKFLVNAQVFTGTPTFNGGIAVNGDAAMPVMVLDSLGDGWYTDFSNAINFSWGIDVDGQQGWINYDGYHGGTTRGRTLNIGNGKRFAIAQFFGTSQQTAINSRLSIGGTSAPTVANVGANSCGTTAATVAGYNNAFTVTVGATGGSQCRVAFSGWNGSNVTNTTEWECSMTGQGATLTGAYYVPVDATHVDFFSTFAAGAKFTATCFPR